MMYVINLARRQDRWMMWQAAAKKWNLPEYIRWEAVDGRSMALTLDSLPFYGKNYFRPKGVIACALSHYRLWEHIIEKKDEQAVIFEDDAIFFTKPFEMPVLPEGWDLFYFGGHNNPSERISGIPVNKNMIIPKLPAGLGLGAYAYMISLEGAKKLVARVEKKGLTEPIDTFLVNAFGELKAYCSMPFVVFADLNSGSDTQGK